MAGTSRLASTLTRAARSTVQLSAGDGAELYPLTFRPRLKERPWGGHRLAELFGKAASPKQRIGESWEICDRPGDESQVSNGPLRGKSLRWLMVHRGRELLGYAPSSQERFPWLCKILDARQDLSLQVHPPTRVARRLNGEPKTEMWFVAEADPEAQLHVGLRRGVTREEFEARARDGTVARCFHRQGVQRGDVMFLPSGRVHAIGGGQVIFEIQQNSDTTYRVFDWNRLGADGRPRALHLAESMASIDFQDFEPSLVQAPFRRDGLAQSRRLVQHALFRIEHWGLSGPGEVELVSGLQVIAVVGGAIEVVGAGRAVPLKAGRYCLIPASISGVRVRSGRGGEWLAVTRSNTKARRR